MKKLLNLTAFLLILAGVLSACKKPDDSKIDYPINISFTEYSLDETSCQWQNLPYDEKVILINSNAALEKYISCAKSSYPAIDFSKNSLLLVSGKTTTGVTEIFAKDLKQLSSQKYELNLTITLSDTSSIEQWCMALIVEKIGNESDVKLSINFDEEEIDYPINISFTEYLLDETSCQWKNLPYDKKVIIINSNEKLESYINCSDGHYPEIDFSEYTLLIANGIASSSIAYSICTNLYQLSKQNFEMNVEIFKTQAAVLKPWQTAIIINKIDADCIIDLKFKYVH